MRRTLSTPLALLFLVPFAAAASESPGGACSPVGSACSWVSQDDEMHTVTFNGTCAPDGFCGDNGAVCTVDDNCYNFCGVDGICGGQGAECTSNAPFAHGQLDLNCFDPAFVCTSNVQGTPGICALQPSSGMRKRWQEQLPRGPSACRRRSDVLCVSNGQAECIDVTSDFSNCGACGLDCSDTEGGDTVECIAGVCLVADCRRGWTQVGNSCVRDHVVAPMDLPELAYV